MIACFSPHPDDAVLSCGGLLTTRRPAHVVTIFAGPAPAVEELTPFARAQHLDWGDLPDPMAHRRREDAAALDRLGCRGTWWDYRDAIYRHPAYCSEEAIFGPLADEAMLEEELVQCCQAVPADLLLFPLAVGEHVDHQLIFRVGWTLYESGRRVAFYEDLPYTARIGGPGPRLEALALPLFPQLVEVTPAWETKQAAIACYTSQFVVLARTGPPLLEVIAGYAASLSPGGYAERLWWPEEDQWI